MPAGRSLVVDRIHQTFATQDVADPTLVAQIEKLNKSLEARKANLGARFIDRGKKRKTKDGMTFLDLFENFSDNANNIEKDAEEKRQLLKDKKSQFINPIEYMEEHMGGANKEKEEPKD